MIDRVADAIRRWRHGPCMHLAGECESCDQIRDLMYTNMLAGFKQGCGRAATPEEIDEFGWGLERRFPDVY